LEAGKILQIGAVTNFAGKKIEIRSWKIFPAGVEKFNRQLENFTNLTAGTSHNPTIKFFQQLESKHI